jgi:hypothetical protein
MPLPCILFIVYKSDLSLPKILVHGIEYNEKCFFVAVRNDASRHEGINRSGVMEAYSLTSALRWI